MLVLTSGELREAAKSLSAVPRSIRRYEFSLHSTFQPFDGKHPQVCAPPLDPVHPPLVTTSSPSRRTPDSRCWHSVRQAGDRAASAPRTAATSRRLPRSLLSSLSSDALEMTPLKPPTLRWRQRRRAQRVAAGAAEASAGVAAAAAAAAAVRAHRRPRSDEPLRRLAKAQGGQRRWPAEAVDEVEDGSRWQPRKEALRVMFESADDDDDDEEAGGWSASPLPAPGTLTWTLNWTALTRSLN